MVILDKIKFLKKSKASPNIIKNFLFNKFFNVLIKNSIIKNKRNHQLALQNKKITNDYFSAHAYNFYYYLSKLKSNFNYLEIGSYEGNSAIFIANKFIDSKISCVDNWTSTEEYIDHISFQDIEENFNFNIKDYTNIKKIKKSSDDFFKHNKEMFDVIYIDGHHLGSQVFKDCTNAWQKLNNNGYLICDDYIWKFYPDFMENPCYAINKFLENIKGFFNVEKVSNSQIFIKKISDKS